MSEILVFSLGSNLGDRLENLRFGIQALQSKIGKWLANSSVYETEPVGVTGFQNTYYNMVAVFSTNRSPEELLRITQQIERESGRLSKGDLQPRILDIDIILLGNKSISQPGLIIPHPRFREREFVLRPLLEVVPYIELNGILLKRPSQDRMKMIGFL